MMNKDYFMKFYLIVVILVLVVGIGLFVLYRSTTVQPSAVIPISPSNTAPTQTLDIIINTDKADYKQGEMVEITIKNNLNKSIRYWEGKKNRDTPFIIEKFGNGDWNEISIPGACSCDPRCYQEAPGIMEFRPGKEIDYRWNQKEGCQRKFVGKGKYRV